MTDTVSGNGISTLHHDSEAPVRSDSSGDSRNPPTNNLPVQKRTRSQVEVTDLILRLPLSRSPLKDARKANTKGRGTPPVSQTHSQPPAVFQRGVVAGRSMVTNVGAEAAHARDEEINTRADEKSLEEEGSKDSLFSATSHDSESHAEDSSRRTVCPTGTKKRASPDAYAVHATSNPGNEPQPKRAKVGASRILDRRQDLEYRAPLRDPGPNTPSRPKGYRHPSSMKPTPSPSKATSSIFPFRAQSVPLSGENEVRSLDLTAVPPSPRRSPSRGGVEIRRALSVPPPDEDRMDVDVGDDSALLHFTNPTQFTPRANLAFSCTVNFATPRGPVTPPRSGSPFASPLSPLTPLPASPLQEYLSEMGGLPAKKADVNSFAFGDRMSTSTDPSTDPVAVPSAADMDTFQPTTHVPSQSSAAATSYLASAASASTPSQSRLARPSLTSSKPMQLMPAPDDPGGIGKTTTHTPTELSRPQPDSIMPPISRPGVTGSMRSNRGPSIPRGTRRVTRSVSLKVEGVNNEHAESEDIGATSRVTEESVNVAGASSAMSPPSTAITSTPRPPPKSTGATTSKSKPPLTTHRSASLPKPPPNPSKLKQASLNMFIKPKSSVATGGNSTSTTSPSRVAPASSPSKIPLPALSLKHPSTTQAGNTKPFLSSLGFASTGAASRASSGRSLTNLSHALDKLIVPPPSRPNTSMGFVRDGGTNGAESTPEDRKGKGRSRDDGSLPLTSAAQGSGPSTTFARPTASSLNRAATVTGIGSTAIPRMRGHVGATAIVRGTGRGRGTIGIFGRAGDRASKKTSLPVVEGSPVKGSGGTGNPDTDALGAGKHKSASSLLSVEGARVVASEDDVFVTQDNPGRDTVMQVATVEASSTGDVGGSSASRKSSPPTLDDAINLTTTTPISADRGKQRALPCSTLNPASSALHALSESLSSLPQTPTPPRPRAVGTRTGLRSSSAAVTGGKGSPVVDGSGSVGPSGHSEVQGGVAAGPDPNNGTVSGSGGGGKKTSLKILKRCTIFVDVRTEQGDDAGSLFVDMLKGLGARIMARLGRKCTHIVYKNGHSNTLMRYRMLDDPKPVVVGIAWVVECVEKRAQVDEEKFKVDVDTINVAGGNNKRRRSMLPKHLIPASPGPDYDMPTHISSEVDDDDNEGGGGIDGSPSQDPDLSMRSREVDDLPPLERARRRRSILPGGQTRLVP